VTIVRRVVAALCPHPPTPLCCVGLRYVMLCSVMLCCVMLCCVVLRCAVLCLAVLCCAVLCCAVLCCDVLCHVLCMSYITYVYVYIYIYIYCLSTYVCIYIAPRTYQTYVSLEHIKSYMFFCRKWRDRPFRARAVKATLTISAACAQL